MNPALTWFCTSIAAAGIAVELRNLRRFPLLAPERSRAAREIVACVAMRDEAANARNCIASLLAQPEICAVVVCDDGSGDGTREILASIARCDPRVRLVCAQTDSKASALAEAARHAREIPHRYLLFTDADVRLGNGAAAALLAYRERERAEAVTAWPRVRAKTPADALLAPMVTLLLLQALPIWRARSDSRCVAGNGQLFLIERAAYDACGGHAAIRECVEDVALAHALARSGAGIAFASAASIAQVAGYGSLQANLAGLGRSLYAGAGVAGCAAFALWQIAAFSVPFAALFGRAWLAGSVGAACAIGARVLLALRMREPLAAAFAPPLSAVPAAIGAAIAGVRGASGAMRWRGREVRA